MIARNVEPPVLKYRYASIPKSAIAGAGDILACTLRVLEILDRCDFDINQEFEYFDDVEENVIRYRQEI